MTLRKLLDKFDMERTHVSSFAWKVVVAGWKFSIGDRLFFSWPCVSFVALKTLKMFDASQIKSRLLIGRELDQKWANARCSTPPGCDIDLKFWFWSSELQVWTSVFKTWGKVSMKTAQVFIDGSSVSKKPTELGFIWAPEVLRGCYAPPCAKPSDRVRVISDTQYLNLLDEPLKNPELWVCHSKFHDVLSDCSAAFSLVRARLLIPFQIIASKRLGIRFNYYKSSWN